MSQQRHTPGPWQMWTSCSFRRISSAATGYDGDVLHAVVQRSDGHPDLHFPNGGFNGPDALLMLAAPDMYEALKEAQSTLAMLTDPERIKESRVQAAWAQAVAAEAKARAALAKANGAVS